jgi:hypothetical protein
MITKFVFSFSSNGISQQQQQQRYSSTSSSSTSYRFKESFQENDEYQYEENRQV